jgi:hypothetical protein
VPWAGLVYPDAANDPSQLDALEQAGVSRAIFGLPSADRDAVLRRLDALAKVMAS